MSMVVPAMGGLTEGQQRLFILCISLASRFRGDGLDAARDIDVADAADALASTYDTEAKGLIYEQRPGSLPAQRIAGELRTVLDQLGRDRPTAFARDAAATLRRIGRLARSVDKSAPDTRTVFLDLAGRIASRMGPMASRDSAAAVDLPPGDQGRSIILP